MDFPTELYKGRAATPPLGSVTINCFTVISSLEHVAFNCIHTLRPENSLSILGL